MARFEVNMDAAFASPKSRIDWVDYAKGICIILVVMMHSTLGVEKAAGELSWLHGFVDWARPFRMPDFFMISGLFLAARIDRPWREYLDSKVVHFLYFYLLWMTIQFALKAWPIFQAGGLAGLAQGYAMGFVEPFGTLWFIYLLPIFFVVVKLTRHAAPLLIFAVGALLEAAPIETGWLLIDEFASRFIYFYAGFWLAKHIFDFAAKVDATKTLAILSGLVLWAFFNGFMVAHGFSHMPVVSLGLGFVGACAVVATGVLLSKFRLAEALRYCGQNSIVIYLAFFLFMAASRSLLLTYVPGLDLGLAALVVTAAGVIGAILLFRATRNGPLSFLFRRPEAFKLSLFVPRWHKTGHAAQAQPRTRGPSLSH
jgi:uncharacterized membrane protein YcfT